MSYPQSFKNTLTLNRTGFYPESLKTTTTAFAPVRFSDFFVYAYGRLRAGNNQYLPEQLVVAFSETAHTHGLWALLRKTTKMTTINDISGVYANLRQILKKLNQQPGFDSDVDEAESAICNAINALETAIAYLPMEDSTDKKIKLYVLKKTITELCEDANGELHLEDLNEVQRAQLAICLQLIKE